MRIDDLRGAQREGTEGNLVVFVPDPSVDDRPHATEGTNRGMRGVAARPTPAATASPSSWRGSEVRVVVPPTRSVDPAVARLADLRVGGRTPLAEGCLRRTP